MKAKIWYLAALAIFVGMMLPSCDEKTSPTAPSPSHGINTNPPRTTPPPTNTPPATSRTATARIWTNGESVYTEIQNNRGQAENFVFVCYENPTGEISDQIIMKPDHRRSLADGQSTGRLGLRMPKNKDGEMCAVQCDSVQRSTPRIIPHYLPVELLAYFERGEGACVQPCEGDCDPNECTKTPDPSGPGLECEWHGGEICEWGCECKPTTEPECPEQKWNPVTCQWVGLCLCEPSGEKQCETQTWDPVKCKWAGDCDCEPVGDPECPEQTWDPEKCKWVGDCGCTLECGPGEHLHPEDCKCYCDPVGEPECAEQSWNEKTCKWEGPCECEPSGEPECDEQTWDPIKCKWVGDCPCPEQQCDFGYEWDEKKCKCEAEDICHVSNKGGDSDWNIQEQNKKYSPGHGGHMNKSSFCPACTTIMLFFGKYGFWWGWGAGIIPPTPVPAPLTGG